MTIREQIVRAVVERLSTLKTVPRQSIYRSRQQGFASATELPAIVVRKVRDAQNASENFRDLTLGVEIYTRGPDAEADADPIAEEAHRALMTMANAEAVLLPDDTVFDDADADGGAHRTVMIFTARYACDSRDLAQSFS